MYFDSGVFDEDQIDDIQTLYTLDSILEAIGEKSYSVDTVLGNIYSTPYLIGVNVNNNIPSVSYLVDAIIVMDRSSSKFQESIINSIMLSFGKVFEDLSGKIDMMGLRLQLKYADASDLDIFWSRILNLKRRGGEADEDYRSRLAARLNIMKSSGTIPECKTLLDQIVGMDGCADLKSYWPAQLDIKWTSFTAMIRAEERYPAIKEALDEMVAAGVTWGTRFPYKRYQVDALLSGLATTTDPMDAILSKEKWTFYRVSVDIFRAGIHSYDIDVGLETIKPLSYFIDTRLQLTRPKSDLLDVIISTEHTKSDVVDAVLVDGKEKPDEVDAIIERAQEINFYKIDVFAARIKSKSYRLDAVVAL